MHSPWVYGLDLPHICTTMFVSDTGIAALGFLSMHSSDFPRTSSLTFYALSA